MKPRAPKQPGDDWTRGPAAWAAGLIIVIAGILGLRAGLDRIDPPPFVQRAGASGVDRAGAGAPEPAPASGIHAADDPPTSDHAGGAPSALVRIDINSATAAELDLLPGIGPALAERILASRRDIGPFRSIDDLDRVKGIGPRTIEKLRAHISIGSPGAQ